MEAAKASEHRRYNLQNTSANTQEQVAQVVWEVALIQLGRRYASEWSHRPEEV